MNTLLDGLNQDNYEIAAGIAESALGVRGFGHVKQANADRVDRLECALRVVKPAREPLE